jgi:hypothetical protein
MQRMEHESKQIKNVAPIKKQVSTRPCGNCDASQQQARESAFKAELLEKELFSVKNEKMQAVLEQRVAEERLKGMAKE